MIHRIRSLVALLGLLIPLGVYANPAIEVDPQKRNPPAPAKNGAGTSAETPKPQPSAGPAQTGTPQPSTGPAQTGPAQPSAGTPQTGTAQTGTGPESVPAQLKTDTPSAQTISQSQEPVQINSLAELDAEAQKAGNGIRQGLEALPKGARIRIGQFLLNGAETDLGVYWRNQLSSILSSMPDRKFVIVTDPNAPTDYTLTGEIMRIGNILRLYTRLTRIQDSALMTTWTLDMILTPFIQQLAGLSPGGGASANAVQPDSYEPDSRDNPLKADLGGPEIPRTLHDGDEDWFSIQTPNNGTLILETTGDVDTFMELYDGASGSGSRLANNDDGGDDLNARIEYFAEAGKLYIAKVRGLGGDTGSYGFKTTFNALAPDASEPNDTKETGTTIELDTPVEASFQSPEDVDWYVLTIPGDGGYLIVHTDGEMDTAVTIYDESGAVLAEDDDSGRQLNARASTLAPGGKVYIEVREVDGDRGRYTLNTQVREPGASDAFEPDNTTDTAKPIDLETPQQRTLTTADDTDWAQFTITEPGTYEIRTVAEDGHLDTYVELYDENEEYLDDDDDGGDNYDARLRVELQPGKYYLMIRTLDDDPLDNNAYTLRVTAEEADADEDEGM